MTDLSSNSRTVSFDILKRVFFKGGYASGLLRGRGTADLSRRDLSLATEITYGVIRWKNRLDHIIKSLSDRNFDDIDSDVLIILRMGLYQLIFLNRVPQSAAVNESVKIAKKELHKGAANFVNALLRRASRDLEGAAFPDPDENPRDYINTFLSQPRWMAERWIERYGPEKALRIAKKLNEPLPLVIRTNQLKIQPEELYIRLKTAGVKITALPYEPAFEVDGEALSTEEFAKGLFYVQSSASQLVSLLVYDGKGGRILDACSAPGGKLSHLAALGRNGGGTVVGMDSNIRKLWIIHENLRKLGCAETPVVGGALPGAPFRIGFDAVLLDAPCSGMGTVRTNPEIKWRITERDLIELHEKQYEMLTAVSDLVKSGGKLVYSVCTQEPEETTRAVGRFLVENEDFDLISPMEYLPPAFEDMVKGNFFMTSPEDHETEGFFAAVLMKK